MSILSALEKVAIIGSLVEPTLIGRENYDYSNRLSCGLMHATKKGPGRQHRGLCKPKENPAGTKIRRMALKGRITLR